MGNLFAKPFALGIGPQACGTEKLRSYFSGRDDVALPNVQEIFYFDRHVQRGPLFYKEHFDHVMVTSLVMELTTTAFDHPQAPERAAELLGRDTKLFCLLRNPVERSFAVYQQYLTYGIVKGDIEKACEQAPQILYSSRYADHIENWQEYFDQIHFLTYEQLETAQGEALADLCAYLDLPFVKPKRTMDWQSVLPKVWFPKNSSSSDKVNKSDKRQQISWLKKELSGEVERVNKLISLNLF